MSRGTDNQAYQPPPLLSDFTLLICQVLKVCLDHRISKLPSIPLVKFLYLSECEYYRLYRRRLTTLGWFFYKYGPWTSEITRANPELIEQENKAIETDKCVKYFRIDSLAARLHGNYIEDIEACMVVKHVVTPWAKRFVEEDANWEIIIRELLNEVYYHTEPMRHAKFGEPLDFTLIPPTKPSIEIKLSPPRIAEIKKQLYKIKKSQLHLQSLYPLPELYPSVREKVAVALERLEIEDSNWITGDVSINLNDINTELGIE